MKVENNFLWVKNVVNILVNHYQIRYPVNIKSLIKRLGGIIEKREYLGYYNDTEFITGVIKKIGDNSFSIIPGIKINKKEVNFYLAHMLGHLFLHMEFKDSNSLKWHSILNYPDTTGNKDDFEADAFANYLLLPYNDQLKLSYLIKDENNEYKQVPMNNYLDVPNQLLKEFYNITSI